MKAVIYHNPRCSTSRKALAMIRDAGIEPEIIEYLLHPPGRERLAALIRDAGLSVREAIRAKEPAYARLGLDDPGLDDEALIDAMVREPVLIQRPFVQTALGTRLGRPVEAVQEILPPAVTP
ncbi:arsenate reductase (glutaredoxin) [Luteimonas granuli]|uniref:Arsenate reductase n=1 Tax=Luteimonas granuli TaxID=1176533 RepID=A0A518N276_9GAMM|nr:arsenate reductase (glutaredoxin) [Luteimonas granuli]QDW66020.1 arsenate reductase (glutaredoxin) [Luteimonas granuli]